MKASLDSTLESYKLYKSSEVIWGYHLMDLWTLKGTYGRVFTPVLGAISPERLSGGVQTLIMIYKKPELIFDATSCGPNCAKRLLTIGQKKDVTVNLNYLMNFEKSDDFEVFIENENRCITNINDYLMTAVKYV